MGIVLPRNGRELLPRVSVHAVRRHIPSRPWWLLPLAMVAVGYVPVAIAAPGLSGLVLLAWILAPFVGMMAWTNAARRAPTRMRMAFLSFAAAAGMAVAGELAWSIEVYVLGTASIPVSLYVLLVPHVLVAIGCGLSSGSRAAGESVTGIAGDVVVLVLAGAVVGFRYVVEPLLVTDVVGSNRLALLAMLECLAIIPVAFAAFLLLRRGSALPPRSAVLLLAGTLAFAVGSVLAGSADPRPLVRGDGFDAIWILGWVVFAASGFGARVVAPTARGMLDRRRAHDNLRKLIVPAAALLLGVAAIDLGLRPTARPETLFAIGLLAGMLALRTAHAFSLADRDAAQRRQIAHARALVEVTHALAGTTSFDRTLRVIAESARSILGTKAAGIELLTADGEELEVRTALGMPDSMLGLRFPINGSFTGWVIQNGEPRAAMDATSDPYIHPRGLPYLGQVPVAAAPLQCAGETLGALFTCVRGEPFDAEELNLLGALAEQAAIAMQNARLFEQVTRLSVTDPLTGLGNRRQLERELAREVAAAHRGRPLVAVIFDLDDFKVYNDTYGHVAGDRALQVFATALREHTRAMNFASRYGGDEFVVLLSETDPDGASRFIERVCDRFAELVHPVAEHDLRVSAGLATFSPEMEGPESLIAAADRALYRVKERVRT